MNRDIAIYWLTVLIGLCISWVLILIIDSLSNKKVKNHASVQEEDNPSNVL